MGGMVQFSRRYADFATQARPFERSTDVCLVVTDFLSRWGYPVNALIGAEFSAQWLGDGEPGPNDPDNLDLIFRMVETEVSEAFFEVVLRDAHGVPVYGGWLLPADTLELTDEIVNGQRVIIGRTTGGGLVRHEFHPGEGGYVPLPQAPSVAAMAIRRRQIRAAA